MSESHRCELSVEEHIQCVVVAVAAIGIGGGCEGTYKALLEVAEGLKQYFHYPEYKPTGEYVVNHFNNPPEPLQYLAPMPTTKQ